MFAILKYECLLCGFFSWINGNENTRWLVGVEFGIIEHE